MTTIHRKSRRATEATTIICLHASGGSGAQWRALADRMHSDFRVLTPDFYGHGATPTWNGAPATIVAADAARIARLAAGAAGPVHLVGHSYGGAVALRVALYHPDLVASVAVYEPVAMRVLFDYNPKHRAAAEVAEVAGAIGRELNGGNMERAAHRFYDYWSGAGSWAALAQERRVALARRMAVIHAHFASLTRDVVELRDYRRLDVPVLYLTGRGTRASTRRIGELLRYALPRVGSLAFDAMGHLGPVTHAGTVAHAIASFIGDRTLPRAVDERKAA